jgi:hypothetical protein
MDEIGLPSMNHKRPHRLTLIVGAALAALTVWLVLTSGKGVVRANDGTIPVVQGTAIPAGSTVLETVPDGISFKERAAPSTLPSGQTPISRGQAIQDAEAVFNPSDQPNARVSAVYALYSNTEYGSRQPNGQVQPFFQDRPAWIVRFTGINLPEIGGIYAQMHPDERASSMNHEQFIFVDAVTGDFLGGYTYR